MSSHTIRPLALADTDAFRTFRGDALAASPQTFGTAAETWWAAPRDAVERLIEAHAAPETDHALQHRPRSPRAIPVALPVPSGNDGASTSAMERESMSDELEALARKGRAGQAKNQSAQQARQSEEQKAAEKERERALSKALGGRGMWAAAIFVIMFVVGGIAVAYLQSTGEPWGTPVKIGFFVGAVVFAGLLVVSQRLEKAHHRKLAMAWLEALPFEFAIDAYLDGLARERMTTKVSLTVRFETPPADDKRDLVADAASGAADVARTRWENQALHIRSAPLSTYRSGNADRASTYTNAAVHRWFCALVDNGLLAIHANYPVREVTCEMTN